MPFEPLAFDPARPGLLRPARVDRAGLKGPTPRQARSDGWRRTTRGLFLPAGVERGVDQRIVEAADALPSYGGLTGWAALRWSHGRWFDGTTDSGRAERPVWLATGGLNIRAQAGFEVCKEKLDPRDLTELDGLRVCSAVRSLCFEMRYASSTRRAVVALDMAAYDDLVSIAEITAYAERHSGWTGIPQCREAIALGEENSWSPSETLMRLIWVLDAGLPRPLANTPIFDRDGHHLGTPDLLDEEAGFIGEYDGALHLQGAVRSRDLRRESTFRNAGLEYFTMLAGDGADTSGVIDRMLASRRRAHWEAPSRRAWTTEPPSWWTATTSVESRRGLTLEERRRLLRYRVA